MNANERQLLTRFLDQMKKAGHVEKDPEADTLIQSAIKDQPDAAYLLVQRTLLLEQALDNAKSRISSLEQTARPPTSFLAGQQADPWGAAPSAPAVRQAPPAYAQPVQPQAYAQPSAPGSSFLGNVATTAAGVVAGSFLFQGIENLMHSGHGSPGWGNDVGAQDHLTENTTINNYYGSDPGQTGSDFMTASYDDGQGIQSDMDDFDSGSGDDSWI